MGRARFQALQRRKGHAVRARTCGALVSAFLVAVGALDPAAALGQTPPCKERETTRPAAEDATNLLELQSNAARPTFDVELAYNTNGGDDISFTPMAGRRPSSADVGAEFTDAPRYDGRRLRGERFVAAHASESGRQIVLEACFEKIPEYDAGRWEGTISIYGPQLSDFTYAIVVTTKWPRWTAIAAIVVTIVLALVAALVTNQLRLPKQDWRRDWKAYLVLAFTLVVAVAVAGLPYWSVYVSNETWGSTPATDLTALVTATFGAAVAGLATAKKLFSTNSSENPGPESFANASEQGALQRGHD